MYKCVTVFILCIFAQHALAESKASRHPSLVCFGDSLSDVGSTYIATKESWPVKKVYPQYAFSNAVTWVSYLAKGKNNAKKNRRIDEIISEAFNETEPTDDAHSFAVENYALGGATTDAAFIQGYTGPAMTWPVYGGKQQMEMFLLRNSMTKPKNNNDYVFAIWLGANDFFYRWLSGQALSDTTFLTSLANNIVNMVTAIAADFPNSTIVVLNAYPIESVPFMLPYLTPDVTGAADKFNNILSTQLTSVHANLTATSVQLVQVNVTLVLRTVIANAPDGVSTNTTCVQGDVTLPSVKICSKPNKFVFYDSFHPTAWIHRTIAKAVFNSLP